MNRIVVVGNGIAGLTACDALREGGFDGELIVIGEESHPPYSRPALSKSLLGGDTEAHLLPEPTHGAITLHATAHRLDAERRRITLCDGTSQGYDGLVIASGSRARRLSWSEREVTLRGLDDALLLRERLAALPSVIVIGGGALGMEVASACLALGCEVTLVSRGRPLAAQLGTYLSDLITAAAVERGLRIVVTSTAVADQVEPDRRVSVGGGEVLEADLVVSAVGDVPNLGWMASSGLLTGGELRVDSRSRVRPDVVAAGDVATVPTADGFRRMPLWSSAIEQARCAANALLDGDAAPELAHQPYFWTEQFGISLKAVGELPLRGAPECLAGDPGELSALLRWEHADQTGTAVALNQRIAIPKLRVLS